MSRSHAEPVPTPPHDAPSTWCDSPAGPWYERPGPVPLLLSAPHAVQQVRGGAPKRAEESTRELVEDLTRRLSCSGLHTTGTQTGDPNWDDGSPYVRRLLAWSPRPAVVVDLHVMRPRGVDVCLGLGDRPETTRAVWPALAGPLVEGGLTVSLNWPFSAGPRTVTSQLQRAGLVAVQVEVSYECLSPQTYPRTLVLLEQGLRQVVEALPPTG